MRWFGCKSALAASTSTRTAPLSTTQTPLATTSSQVTLLSVHSTNVCAESDRFDKDYAVADQRLRQQQWEKKQDMYAQARQERYSRDAQRYDFMAMEDRQAANRLQTKIEQYGAGKKNQGGAAYNLLTMQYESNNRGNNLQRQEEDANTRALYRAANLQERGNGQYDILTGVD